MTGGGMLVSAAGNLAGGLVLALVLAQLAVRRPALRARLAAAAWLVLAVASVWQAAAAGAVILLLVVPAALVNAVLIGSTATAREAPRRDGRQGAAWWRAASGDGSRIGGRHRTGRGIRLARAPVDGPPVGGPPADGPLAGAVLAAVAMAAVQPVAAPSLRVALGLGLAVVLAGGLLAARRGAAAQACGLLVIQAGITLLALAVPSRPWCAVLAAVPVLPGLLLLRRVVPR